MEFLPNRKCNKSEHFFLSFFLSFLLSCPTKICKTVIVNMNWLTCFAIRSFIPISTLARVTIISSHCAGCSILARTACAWINWQIYRFGMLRIFSLLTQIRKTTTATLFEFPFTNCIFQSGFLTAISPLSTVNSIK